MICIPCVKNAFCFLLSVEAVYCQEVQSAKDVVEFVFDGIKDPLNAGVLKRGSRGNVLVSFLNETGKQIAISSTYGSCTCVDIKPVRNIVPSGHKVELEVKISTQKVGDKGIAGGMLFAFEDAPEVIVRSSFQLFYSVQSDSAFPSEILPVKVDPFHPKPISLAIKNFGRKWFAPTIRLDEEIGEVRLSRLEAEAKDVDYDEYAARIEFKNSFLSQLKLADRDVVLTLFARQDEFSNVLHEVDSMILSVSASNWLVLKPGALESDRETTKITFTVLQHSRYESPLAECDFSTVTHRKADSVELEIKHETAVVSSRWIEFSCSFPNEVKIDEIRLLVSRSGEQIGRVIVPIRR